MSARPERRRPVSKAALFAALGDETRLRLIDRLADGDFGFVLGMFALFWTLDRWGQGTLVVRDIAARVSLLEGQTIWGIVAPTFITLMLFIGATGKSAQLPLYVWLPDAMAGPTPVSALIHAATMVTAGVYMIGRLNFLFDLSPGTLQSSPR